MGQLTLHGLNLGLGRYIRCLAQASLAPGWDIDMVNLGLRLDKPWLARPNLRSGFDHPSLGPAWPINGLVLLMDEGLIILGRPWIYDLNVFNFRAPNIYVFQNEGKKTKRSPLPPKHIEDKKVSTTKPSDHSQTSLAKTLNIMCVLRNLKWIFK